MSVDFKLPDLHAAEPPSVVAFIKSGDPDKAYRLAKLHQIRCIIGAIGTVIGLGVLAYLKLH